MKLILDRLADLELAIPHWSDSAWHTLEHAATRQSPTRDQVRATALRCAQCCQRDAILPYAVESASSHIPVTVGPQGRQAIADAVTAVFDRGSQLRRADGAPSPGRRDATTVTLSLGESPSGVCDSARG
jgi:hypothetical protein